MSEINVRVFKKNTVFEEALERVRFLFDEFDDVWVSISGGKDSTTIFELAKIVAREKGRLPLKTVFLDQEAEYQSTIDVVKEIMYDDEVDPYWLQVPIKLFNATSSKTEWLECWNPDEEDIWMRPKDPISYKENVWGTDRFADFLEKFLETENRKQGENVKSCYLTGVRGEESPNRLTALTYAPCYKWVTWGKKHSRNKNVFTFHPIYDWSYTDIWKAIHDNNWTYNKVYDYQYQYGVNMMAMRVSNLHHETSVHSLFMLQEVEPDTYQKLTQRIDGADTAGKLGADDYFIKELPYMFKDWREYRDFLLEKLITKEEYREKFKRMFDAQEKKYGIAVSEKEMFRHHINAMMTNDHHGAKLANAGSNFKKKLKDYKRSIVNEEKARRRNAKKRTQ